MSNQNFDIYNNVLTIFNITDFARDYAIFNTGYIGNIPI